MTTHDEMVKALEGLNKIRSEFPKEGFISLESGVVAKETTANLYYASLTIAISCIDALLNAGEVFGEPLGKADENIPDDKEEAYRLGSKDTRSEDTAILAKRMMGLEEVIKAEIEGWRKCIPVRDMGEIQAMDYEILRKRLALAITQHLKGEGK